MDESNQLSDNARRIVGFGHATLGGNDAGGHIFLWEEGHGPSRKELRRVGAYDCPECVARMPAYLKDDPVRA